MQTKRKVQGGRPDRALWYRRPAGRWEEALPLGCGSLGMMVYGGAGREVLQLNEETLWTGRPARWDNPEALSHLEEVRAALFARDYDRAEALTRRYLVCRGDGTASEDYGTYQTAGELLLETPVSDGGGCLRLLDLERGVAETRFGGLSRTCIASHRYQVLACRIRGLAGPLDLSYRRPEGSCTAADGALDVRIENPALTCALRVEVETDGAAAARADGLRVSDAKEATLWICAVTTYGARDPEAVCRARLDRARAAGFDRVLQEEADYIGERMGRCRLSLAEDPEAAALPTDERLARVMAGAEDPGLCRLLFDYGRYLLIGSAGGLLPANLQGVWSGGMATPWSGDYHLNINLQMNYWPAFPTGLEELTASYFRYLEGLTVPGAQTARTMYGCGGWVAHTCSNLWGFTAPGQDPAWGSFLCAGPWLCRDIWRHYRYTGDVDHLRRLWPVMEGCARFFRDFLVEDPESGYLVTAPSSSPENRFRTPDGAIHALSPCPAMDSEILRDFFRAAAEAARVLGVSGPLTDALPHLAERLPPIRISPSTGGVQEWLEDLEEAEPGHRHISHLFALYPGEEISPQETPALAEAARRTLERRLAHGGGHTGWSRVWIIHFYARLGDGAAAERHLLALLRKSTLPNLFDDHPPFQIDGNFGVVSAICEMLAQRRGDTVSLLPALPPAWREGALDGLRLPGGLSLSLRWAEGVVTGGSLLSRADSSITLRLNGKSVPLALAAGQPAALPV